MLLSLLARRFGAADSPDESFRWRGDGVSRIEGLSDTVFGFAITLLVVALEVPKTSDDLVSMMLQFVPFAASFALLFAIWRAQFEFFRCYGLEDKATVRLTGVLLMGVMFAVYPVKFLFTFLLLVLPKAVLVGHIVDVRRVRPLENLPRVMGLYGFGVFWIATVFSMLYAHAYSHRAALALTDVETFDTDSMRRRWRRGAFVGATIVVWCLSLLAIGGHMRARDNVFGAVYFGGCAVVFAISISQAFFRRTIARERRVLLARIQAVDIPAPG